MKSHSKEVFVIKLHITVRMNMTALKGKVRTRRGEGGEDATNRAKEMLFVFLLPI